MKLNYGYDKPDYGKCEYCHCDKHEEKCCDDHKYAKCYPKNPCPYPILFECAQGPGANIERTDVTSDPFVPRAVGNVTIDTSCLKVPVVKFDFSTVISYRHVGDDGANARARLVFSLFKQCDNGAPMPIGTWDYKINLRDNNERLTNSYSFSHCECNSCPGCCTYFVKVTEAQIDDANDVLEVGCTTLSIIAKSAC